MNYLFETKHFLLRKAAPEDSLRFPGSFPEKGQLRFVVKRDRGHHGNIPDALTIEFRATGASVGTITIGNPSGSPQKTEVLCCLCRGFQKDDFKAEIADAMNTILSASAFPASNLASFDVIPPDLAAPGGSATLLLALGSVVF